MLPASSAYKELVKTNIRPKCEPIITVTGKDASGQNITITWNAAQIQQLSFKRGIDPVGRELPYMELTWTEIYTGKLNAQNYPAKYNNIVKYMAVDLFFKQNLSFHNTWKSIFDGGFSWKAVYEQFNTWKNLRNNVAKETLQMPRMFLAAKPVIQGQTITWTARDLLYFLESSQAKGFEKNVPYKNTLRWFLLDERANFRNSAEIFEALQNTQSGINSDIKDYTIYKNIVADGSTKQVLIGLANAQNHFWIYQRNRARIQNLNTLLEQMLSSPVNTIYDFTANVMYDYPTLTANPSLSAYSFKQYVCELDEANKYTLSPFETIQIKGANIYHFVYKGLGRAVGDNSEGVGRSTYSNTNVLEVIPVNLNGIEFSIQKSDKGEVFVEDNTCNPYNSIDRNIKNRVEWLNRYFNGSYSAEVTSLPNLALEPRDLVTVETNLFNVENRIKKIAVVLRIEIEYNGAIKQKTILHTGADV